MNKKDRKALKKLDEYLKQRQKLVLTDKIVHAAILQRINRLRRTASKLEMDDSGLMGVGLHRLYAWDVDTISRELQFLLNEL